MRSHPLLQIVTGEIQNALSAIMADYSALSAFLLARLKLTQDGRYSSSAAKNDSPCRQARTQYGHILGTKTYHLAPDGTTTRTRLHLIHQ